VLDLTRGREADHDRRGRHVLCTRSKRMR
jgi:hypothetical protein